MDTKLHTITVKEKFIDIEYESSDYYIVSSDNIAHKMLYASPYDKGNMIMIYNGLQVGHTYILPFYCNGYNLNVLTNKCGIMVDRNNIKLNE